MQVAICTNTCDHNSGSLGISNLGNHQQPGHLELSHKLDHGLRVPISVVVDGLSSQEESESRVLQDVLTISYLRLLLHVEGSYCHSHHLFEVFGHSVEARPCFEAGIAVWRVEDHEDHSVGVQCGLVGVCSEQLGVVVLELGPRKSCLNWGDQSQEEKDYYQVLEAHRYQFIQMDRLLNGDKIIHMAGGIVGGLGRFIEMLGAFRPEGSCPVGPTREGIACPGWLGTLPARLIAVALPGLVASASLFLKVWEGGASAVRETMFSPLMMTSPRVRLICLWTPVLLVLVMRYSSVSARTMFICLSKARKVPTIMRASWMVMRTRKSIHCRNLLLWVVINLQQSALSIARAGTGLCFYLQQVASNKLMKQRPTCFQRELQAVCQQSLSNSTQLEQLYSKSRMHFPPIFQPRHLLLNGIAHSLTPSGASPGTSSSLSPSHRPQLHRQSPIYSQKVKVCRIEFEKGRLTSRKPQETPQSSIIVQSPRYQQQATSRSDSKAIHTLENVMQRSLLPQFEDSKCDNRGFSDRTLGTTKPRFICPSLFGGSPKVKETNSIREVISHFSVGQPSEEDQLRLTLQRSKTNLLNEDMEEREGNQHQEERERNKHQEERERGSMDLRKITIYANAEGIAGGKQRRKQPRRNVKKVMGFKQLGSIDPWQMSLQEQDLGGDYLIPKENAFEP